MARGPAHSPIGKIRGKVGDLVFKWYGDRLVVTRAPRPSTKKPTKTQQAGRDRFALASRYAERARKDPEVWALYAAAAKKRLVPARAMAIHDYLTPPKILGVNLNRFQGEPGQPISIYLRDRYGFKTVEITVAIESGTGRRLEAGAARCSAGCWEYAAAKACPRGEPLTIAVTAKDRFGKTATARYASKVGERKTALVQG